MARPSLNLAASEEVAALPINVSYSFPNDRWQVSMPEEVVEGIRGLLAPFDARARRVLVALLNGCSKRRAANRVPIGESTLDTWLKADPRFREAFELCRQLGLGETAEAELEYIAFDREHRGQIRALELMLKARAPEYRDKHQISMEITHRAEAAGDAMLEGYAPLPKLDTT